MLRLTFDIMPQQVHLNFAFTEFFSHAPQPNHKKKHNTDENDNQPYSAVHRLDYPSRLLKRRLHILETPNASFVLKSFALCKSSKSSLVVTGAVMLMTRPDRLALSASRSKVVSKK